MTRALILVKPSCLACASLESLLDDHKAEVKPIKVDSDNGQAFLRDLTALCAFYDFPVDDAVPVAVVVGWDG